MKTTVNLNETAGSAGQMLPGAPSVSVPPLPKFAESRRPPNGSGSPLDTGAAPAAVRPSARIVVAPLPRGGLRAMTPMARIHEIISREVRLFKHAADDLVDVVLTPDAKTQISLRFQWRNGHVTAQARCDLGDYQSLNRQWPQLQSLLAEQGVRLSPLSERSPSGFTDFFNLPDSAPKNGRVNQTDRARDKHQATAAAPPAESAPALPTRPAYRRWLEFWT